MDLLLARAKSLRSISIKVVNIDIVAENTQMLAQHCFSDSFR